MNRKQLREMADDRGYICAKGRKTPSIRITEDGTILRADVRLDLATPMTCKQAAKVLNSHLPPVNVSGCGVCGSPKCNDECGSDYSETYDY